MPFRVHLTETTKRIFAGRADLSSGQTKADISNESDNLWTTVRSSGSRRTSRQHHAADDVCATMIGRTPENALPQRARRRCNAG